jgi:hypothetical protein
MKKISLFIIFQSYNLFGFSSVSENYFKTKPLDSLIELVGQYKFSPNEVVELVTISVESGILKANSADGTYVLKPNTEKADNYTIEELQATVIFIRDEAKKVYGLKVELQGESLEARKIQDEIKK